MLDNMNRGLTGIICLSALVILFFAYLIFAPATAFQDKSRSFIVFKDQINKEDLSDILVEQGIIKKGWPFVWMASQLNLWVKMQPGKYGVKKGANMLTIARTLRNNDQLEVKFVLNKVRTKEDFSKLVGKSLYPDSMHVMDFLISNDSLMAFGLDTNNVFSVFIPDTYKFYWNTPIPKIIVKLKEKSNQFWTNERVEKAKAKGLTTYETYILASIVEEETNMPEDKGKVASVYLNRLKSGMALGADPTVRYALKDFTLKRILYGHLSVQSPYNTYLNKGLPPGPICTPSPSTIDAVLNAPKTDYLFFVAKPDFSGYSNFSASFSEHSRYAKEYQAALDQYLLRKQANKNP